MRSDGNNFKYFLKNKLTKVGKFCAVHTYDYVLSGGLGGLGPLASLGYATGGATILLT